MDRRAGLQVVAEDTGGLSVIGTNNFAGGFQSIVRDNSTYYILGDSPATEYRDGKFHDVVVDQPGADVGSVNVSLAVPAFDEPLALSGIVLGALSTSDAVTLRQDSELRSALGANPTTLRRFPAGDILAAFAEVYSDDPRTTGDDIAVSATIGTAGGETVLSEVADLVEAGSGRPGRWGFKVAMHLRDLVPGDYVLTVEATSSRRPSQPVRRQIPFVVYD